MNNKILQPQLISMMAAASGKSKKLVESFLKAFFSTLAESLVNQENVRIKGLGTFKVSSVEARKSVNVSNGESTEIPAHKKIVFVPQKQLAERVNEEFGWLEIIEIADNLTNEELNNVTDVEIPVVETKEVEIETGKTETGETRKEEIETRAVSQHEEETKGEELGEKLEEEFGDIEPVESFGPIDPDDPEPGTPEPEDKMDDTGEEEERQTEEEITEIPVRVRTKPAEVPKTEPVQENVKVVAETPRKVIVEEPKKVIVEEPKTVESTVNGGGTPVVIHSTANDYDPRKDIAQIEEQSKRRFRAGLLWGFVGSAAIMVIGFLLLYFFLERRISNIYAQTPTDSEKVTEAATDDSSTQTPEIIIEQPATPVVEVPEVKVEDLKVEKETVKKEEPREPKVEAAAKETPKKETDKPLAIDVISKTRFLTTMAREYYGNQHLWPYIYKENSKKLGHPDRIKPGTKVTIPHIEKYGVDPKNAQDVAKAKKMAVEIYQRYNKVYE